MAENSKIAWTTHTFNPWIGCAKVSPGCKNCYAAVDTFARRSRANGLELWGENAARHRTSVDYWKQPIRWNRQAREERERAAAFDRPAPDRPRVFCASLADVFEARPDLDAWRADLARLIETTPEIDWLLLTKRPETMARIAFKSMGWERWPANVWAGTTVEDQQRADERVPLLLQVPAAVRFLSVEPLLGAVRDRSNYAPGWRWPDLDWVIVGTESGPGARRTPVEHVKSIVDQCTAAGVSVFVKQIWSEAAQKAGDPKGGDPSEWPANLRVRQFPEVR